MKTLHRVQQVAFGIAAVASAVLYGCAGRSDVTAGSDQARNLPAQAHLTPQLRPGASRLPSTGEADARPATPTTAPITRPAR